MHTVRKSTLRLSRRSLPVCLTRSTALWRGHCIGHVIERFDTRGRLPRATTRGSALTRIETSALDERLWAHAMVTASSVGKDARKEVVDEFVRAELGGRGREGMRLAYSLYADSGAKCVQALTLPAPTASAGAIPAESLEKWTETIAMILPVRLRLCRLERRLRRTGILRPHMSGQPSTLFAMVMRRLMNVLQLSARAVVSSDPKLRCRIGAPHLANS